MGTEDGMLRRMILREEKRRGRDCRNQSTTKGAALKRNVFVGEHQASNPWIDS